jgi:hypothetical protein
MRKNLEQAQTAGEQTQQKPCRTSSDIGAELEKEKKIQTARSVGKRPYYMRKNVEQANTAGEQTQQIRCRTFSDIGAELENHTVGRCPI